MDIFFTIIIVILALLFVIKRFIRIYKGEESGCASCMKNCTYKDEGKCDKEKNIE